MKRITSLYIIVAFLISGLGVVSLPNVDEINNNTLYQITWTKHIIEEDINHASGIFACDIDNDRDNDVFACSASDDDITLWRNDGGNPIQWSKQIIDDDFAYPMDIFVCDIDTDGDFDLLGAAWEQSEISLWKNNGGNPINWNKQVIKNNYRGAHEVYACDFDHDGDMDIFGASAIGNKINWWRNDGGDPIQWTEYVIDRRFGGARSVFSIDIDGDGDNDVAGAALTDNEIAWWKNEGGQPVEWKKYEIANDFNWSHHVYATDVDQDGHIDILGAAYSDNEIAWWKNMGGNPLRWKKQVIANEFYGAMKVCVDDIDDDGDNDIIASASNCNSISWWSNEGGNPITWIKHTIDDLCYKAWPIQTIDFDDDGDIDVLGGSESSGGIMWYENNLYPLGAKVASQGSLHWTDVKPASTIYGSFSIMNKGSPGSMLNWEIVSNPEWGSWTFQPENGTNLTPEEDPILIEVSVITPYNINQKFIGEVKIVNKDNNNDFATIEISLATSKKNMPIFSSYNEIFFRFLENDLRMFSLFTKLLFSTGGKLI